MKQMLFETRQKAEQLLQEALSVWRQSDKADSLEDLEKDPVFSLLMMALAYQSNETDSEIERLKTEVLEEFSSLLVPYEKGHAMPATAVVETALQDDVAELSFSENTPFLLGNGVPFIPLLGTRALNASVHSISRLDGRRWKVSLNFGHPVGDLSLFAFALNGLNFRNLSVSIKGTLLPLVKPWHYSELPLTSCFSMESLSYNSGRMADMSLLPMDLFARQNVRLFCIEKHDPARFLPAEVENLDLVFEFTGIPEDFKFDKSSISLNPVVLVNAQLHEAKLSQSSPIARLVGSIEDEKDISSRQFLHLIRPGDDQIFGNRELTVRGVAGERFNQGSLLRLLNCIITKYRSDYYAYQQLRSEVSDSAVYQLENALSRLLDESSRNVLQNVHGVYLMPRRNVPDKDFSLNVKYLTTAGAAVNVLLKDSPAFAAPSGFKSEETRMLGAPVPGYDEIQDGNALGGMLRYYMVTGDRIVTMADVKLFCQKELLVRYGLESAMIKRMRVNRRLEQEDNGCGYEVVVEITLADNAFVRRSFADRISMAEIILQKMIEVRSANIYPVRVLINIEEQQ